MTELIKLSEFGRFTGVTFFNKEEFRRLLHIYAMRVATGEWKDYAIDVQGRSASFSVFRHSFETPIYTVTKRVGSRRTDFTLTSGRQVLRTARTLEDVLKAMDKPIRVLPGGAD
jgi:hypothetical protein